MSSRDQTPPMTRNRLATSRRARLAAGLLLAALAVAAVLVGALAGCGAASPAPGATGSPTASLQQQARTVWLQFAHCVRAHGAPSFPDPQVDSQGHADFGQSPQTKAEANQAQGACGSILNRLPASVTGNAPVTAAKLHELTLLAHCMRQHGLPQWPDPQPDGTFRLSATPYATTGKSPQVLGAMQACSQYNAAGSITGSS
jgi:hypothetical protein